MDARKALRRTVPLVLLGAAATVMLRRRLAPRPALPPGPPIDLPEPPLRADVVDHGATDEHAARAAAPAPLDAHAATGEHAAVHAPLPLTPPEVAPAPEPLNERVARRLRQAPVDIVTVVDDLLSAAR